jgi:hypothetical protein
MNATTAPTAAEVTAARETLIEANRLRNLNSPYEGKVWFNKERDDYGRTIRVVKTQQDGRVTTLGVVVCVPRWKAEDKTRMGISRYFTNDWAKGAAIRAEGRFPERDETITQHDKLATALAQFGCGAKEYELYTK